MLLEGQGVGEGKVRMVPNRLLVASLVSGLLVAAGAAAQESPEGPPTPAEYQSGTSCDAHAVKSYLAATDPTKRVDQEWNLRAASAYRELAALGFQEC